MTVLEDTQTYANDSATSIPINTGLAQSSSRHVPRPVVGNLAIVAELEQVRERAAKGQLPAFRRGKLYWSFNAGKVCILPAD